MTTMGGKHNIAMLACTAHAKEPQEPEMLSSSLHNHSFLSVVVVVVDRFASQIGNPVCVGVCFTKQNRKLRWSRIQSSLIDALILSSGSRLSS